MPKTKAQPSPEFVVWIEFQRPQSPEHAKQLEEMAANMLRRLTGADVVNDRFFWSAHESRWCYGGQMGYTVCADNGQWFNLAHFGRQLT